MRLYQRCICLKCCILGVVGLKEYFRCICLHLLTATVQDILYLRICNAAYGLRQAKKCLRACTKCTDSDSSRACSKSHPCICSPLIHSIESNNSVSGQQSSWSDCADAQADLGLRCPHKLEDTFSHGAAHTKQSVVYYMPWISLCVLFCSDICKE